MALVWALTACRSEAWRCWTWECSEFVMKSSMRCLEKVSCSTRVEVDGLREGELLEVFVSQEVR
jgi:hypothetical protein